MGVLFEEFKRWSTRRGDVYSRAHYSRVGTIVRRHARRIHVRGPNRPTVGYCEALMTNPVLAAFGRPFRLGIVGGAPPSMIGPVHRIASSMDQRFVLVAGVPSSRPERSRAEGVAAGLPESRCYGRVEDLL